ncbi:hypothetical protein Varpa_2385 [Variovorax paradoxus EPS]|uniref:Uncharacterized protein n=1 Tax=Variovorax paradoxus (strain EPS) TaxID=595537 RepID=E6UY57_VARPE|nr:hypothetical protein Varpa_2385 [Variovorax paradoxus EPS]
MTNSRPGHIRCASIKTEYIVQKELTACAVN